MLKYLWIVLILIGFGTIFTNCSKDSEDGNTSNIPPIANAGSDQTVMLGSSVTLNGSSSSDSDGYIVKYIWEEGPIVLSSQSSFSKSDFSVGTHTITLTVIDNDGAMDSDSVIVTVNALIIRNVLKKTGQTASYTNYDDGYYEKGLTPRYTRASNSITDEVTQLMWQDDEVPDVTTLDKAITYCKNLSLDGYTDWRLPTRIELVGLSDYSRYSPAINPIFQNTVSGAYWSSNIYVNNTQYVWVVTFRNGAQLPDLGASYVRCVRTGQ